MKIRLPVLIGVGAAALLPIVIPLCCSGDEFLDDAMERYDFASWAGTTNAAYVSAVPMMDVPTISLPTNGMSTFAKFMSDSEYQEKDLLIFSPSNKIQLLEIKMCFATNVLSAQTALMQHFADIPLVRQYSVTNGLAGDRCYCLTLPDGFSCVDFTRNNVFVDIAAYTNCLSAFDIAVQLDAAILNVSTNAPGR